MSIVWESKLDGKYDIVVSRNRPASIDPDIPLSAEELYSGTLTITEGKRILFTKEVSISYGAVFGADASDIRSWQNIAIDFIDG